MTHELVLDVDAFGNLKRKASIAYGRSAANAEQPEQQKSWATLVESDFINEPNRADFYRVGIEYESRSFELTGLALPAGGQGLIGFDALKNALLSATDIDFEIASTNGVQRRLIDRKQQLFYENDLSGPLALGAIESLALPYGRASRNTPIIAATRIEGGGRPCSAAQLGGAALTRARPPYQRTNAGAHPHGYSTPRAPEPE